MAVVVAGKRVLFAQRPADERAGLRVVIEQLFSSLSLTTLLPRPVGQRRRRQRVSYSSVQLLTWKSSRSAGVADGIQLMSASQRRPCAQACQLAAAAVATNSPTSQSFQGGRLVFEPPGGCSASVIQFAFYSKLDTARRKRARSAHGRPVCLLWPTRATSRAGHWASARACRLGSRGALARQMRA